MNPKEVPTEKRSGHKRVPRQQGGLDLEEVWTRKRSEPKRFKPTKRSKVIKLKGKGLDIKIHPSEKRSEPQGRSNSINRWGGLGHREGLKLT